MPTESGKKQNIVCIFRLVKNDYNFKCQNYYETRILSPGFPALVPKFRSNSHASPRSAVPRCSYCVCVPARPRRNLPISRYTDVWEKKTNKQKTRNKKKYKIKRKRVRHACHERGNEFLKTVFVLDYDADSRCPRAHSPVSSGLAGSPVEISLTSLSPTTAIKIIWQIVYARAC